MDSWLKVSKDLLQSLIRAAPVNPSSNEEKAAKILASRLGKAGLDIELVHKEGFEKRLNVIARIEGKNPRAAKIGLLSHLDVVPPGDRKKWTYPPFEAVEKDGFIWGRGAIDCLGTVATEASAMIRLAEEGFKPEGDIIFIAEADEEVGGEYGAKFLTNELWEKVFVDYLINEGGGLPLSSQKGTKYLIANAEKGPCWVEWTIKGKAGHASVPDNTHNAVLIASELVKKITKSKQPILITKEFKEFVQSYGLPFLLKSKVGFSLLLPLLKFFMPEEAVFLESMVKTTVSPTIIKGGEKENIIPDVTKIVFDTRLVPHYPIEKALNDLLNKAKKKQRKNISQKLLLGYEGTSSTTQSSFYRIIQKEIAKLIPQSKLIPFIVPGTTDSRFWRIKGSRAYGFTPFSNVLSFQELSTLSHNYNERIDLKSLDLMNKFFYNLTKNFQSKKRERILTQEK